MKFKRITNESQNAQKLKDKGELFHWTIVGDGTDRDSLIRLIKENNLEEEVTLVGAKSNPYPYKERQICLC